MKVTFEEMNELTRMFAKDNIHLVTTDPETDEGVIAFYKEYGWTIEEYRAVHQRMFDPNGDREAAMQAVLDDKSLSIDMVAYQLAYLEMKYHQADFTKLVESKLNE